MREAGHEEEDQDQEEVMLTVQAWARAYATLNLAQRVKDPAPKAAALTKKIFPVLHSRAAAHVQSGAGAEELLAVFEADFFNAYAVAALPVTMPSEDRRQYPSLACRRTRQGGSQCAPRPPGQ